jgi:Flp pilus assembly protein TadD
VTAIALAAATVLVWPRSRPDLLVQAAPSRTARKQTAVALGIAAVVIALIATGASLTRQGLAQVFRSRAQSELVSDPAAALTNANRSLNIDADSTRTYYVKAAAQARFDQAGAAEATLLKALAREPENFVTWALLGDVAVREGRLTVARLDYVRAHELNPRNRVLAELAVSPRGGTH